MSSFFKQSLSISLRDRWSIGIIVMEMLVGSELILVRKSLDEFEELFESIQRYIEPAT